MMGMGSRRMCTKISHCQRPNHIQHTSWFGHETNDRPRHDLNDEPTHSLSSPGPHLWRLLVLELVVPVLEEQHLGLMCRQPLARLEVIIVSTATCMTTQRTDQDAVRSFRPEARNLCKRGDVLRWRLWLSCLEWW